ncbi:MAG: ABC transporter ATP-binding protein, partial [Moorella sp. (in: Bacteria)]|nr:ABC transporter ATP-binding protein [Moorella sp. (in: firmicutes)]
EHDLDVVFSVAEKIMVMHQGQTIAEGRPDEVRASEEVQKAYLGETA